MNDINKDIGHRIKHLREDAGLNQSALGSYLGVGKTMVSKYEAGAAKVTPESLLTLSSLFDVTLDYLMLGKDATTKTPEATKEDALRLVLTSDSALVESIKAELRNQIREETPSYNGLTSNEQRLLKAYRLLDDKRQERLIDTAEDMSVALSRGFDSNQGEGDCVGSK